jgi:putative PIN family toxin of toxin-antitoxin system
VAAFATRGLCADVLRTFLAEHELILSDMIMGELERALTRKLKLSEEQIAAAKAVFGAVELIAKPAKPSKVPVRDPSDRWVLASAIAGRAEVLVTGDDDLLSVASKTPLLILSPRAFWERLRSGQAEQ